jgi:cytochrome P450
MHNDNDSTDTNTDSPITNSAKVHLETFFNMITRNPDIQKGGKKSLAAFHASHQEIKSFMKSLVNYRRRYPSSKRDLLSSMLNSYGAQTLSGEEIEGNLFLFMFAGHETTANTLVYIAYLLAIFPGWQTWAIQEIDEIFSGVPLDNEIPYKDIVNRLVRVKAIMVTNFQSPSINEPD